MAYTYVYGKGVKGYAMTASAFVQYIKTHSVFVIKVWLGMSNGEKWWVSTEGDPRSITDCFYLTAISRAEFINYVLMKNIFHNTFCVNYREAAS